MRAALLLILVLATAANAATICNGDSNTQSNWQGFPNGTADGWCEQVGGINRGVGGSTIADSGAYFGTLPLWGGYYIDAEVAGVDPFAQFATSGVFLGQAVRFPFPLADVVIMAFGTNDVRAGWTPSQIIHYLKKYRQRVIAAGGVPYIATTPPQFDDACAISSNDATIQLLNQRIRGNWPQRYVEFHDGFDCADFMPDGIHLTAGGQAKRAAAAAAVLPLEGMR